jgi:YidC/Oxa1 family membrane protein insertase
MIDFDVKLVGLEEVLVKNNNELAFNWNLKAPSKEKGKEPQYAATTVFYKYVDDEVDYISETSDDKQELEASTKWVSFKQQFFSASVIANKSFDKVNGMLETKKLEGSKKYTKFLAADLTLVFERELDPSFGMQFYFGPNHYQTLDAYNLNLEQQIDLGWGIFGWVNEYLIIEVFNFLDGFNLNYGIIILLLTVFIKLLLSPLTYKNYLSSAKTRVLKPEIDELNAKFKDGDAMKKQQATMSLYRQAGVNPMAGCVPMILQFPILIAMYRFFPASIELRQESFLWADDLSSYDSIFDLGFSIPFYGDHVSLFTILMAISTMLYTKYNSQTATMGGGMQAQQMKIMMYIMPIFFLGFFNNFSAGLSYYYFLANVISMVQQWVIKKFFIDEDAIHRKIQENKKKPKAQKKSKFQQRLEDMAKQRGYNPPKK